MGQKETPRICGNEDGIDQQTQVLYILFVKTVITAQWNLLRMRKQRACDTGLERGPLASGHLIKGKAHGGRVSDYSV